MIRCNLQNCVENRFGMSLDRFIRHHAQVKSLCDYEIADILNVNSVLVGRLRKRYGIQKADGFSRRFRDSYGEDALEVFQKIVKEPDTSLSDAARHFGFSRQYASDVYKKIYGRCYRETRQRAHL